jgi:menaquinol-cytochrome c reductase iron-sulfur subunit
MSTDKPEREEDAKAEAKAEAKADAKAEAKAAADAKADAHARAESDEDEHEHEHEEEEAPPSKAGGHNHIEPPPASADTIARRQLLGKMSVGLGVAGGVALGVPIVGFVFAPLFRGTPRTWRPVGPVSRFRIGETVNVVFVDASPLPWAGVTSKTAAWLRRVSEDKFEAFSVNCAHLGCPVRWMPEARLFMCPCHGGVYYEDGTVAAGPPPHALPQYPVRINEGQVEIHTDPIPIG